MKDCRVGYPISQRPLLSFSKRGLCFCLFFLNPRSLKCRTMGEHRGADLYCRLVYKPLINLLTFGHISHSQLLSPECIMLSNRHIISHHFCSFSVVHSSLNTLSYALHLPEIIDLSCNCEQIPSRTSLAGMAVFIPFCIFIFISVCLRKEKRWA